MTWKMEKEGEGQGGFGTYREVWRMLERVRPGMMALAYSKIARYIGRSRGGEGQSWPSEVVPEEVVTARLVDSAMAGVWSFAICFP